MNNIFKVIILIVLLIIILIVGSHYYKYINKTQIYEIVQSELDNIDGYGLYTNKDPLVITFIEDETLKFNIDKYSLKTPITIQEKYFNLNLKKKYYLHKYEICLIRPINDITITLINPKLSKFFSKIQYEAPFDTFDLPSENFSEVNSIDIVLRRHNIFCIPRFWLFSFDTNNEIEIFVTHNIFTKLFSFFL